MFRKLLIGAMFATAAGYCYAAETMPQIVTSEVFYEQEKKVDENQWELVDTTVVDTAVVDTVETYQENVPVPAWPIAGSEADVDVSCKNGVSSKKKQGDNIRIVSKIGSDLVVENNINLGAPGGYGNWSGGANMLHGTQIPVGFDDECNSGSEMALMHREVLEDDGGNVLTVSRSGRKTCGKYADNYDAFAVKMNMKAETKDETKAETENVTEAVVSETEVVVDASADAEAPVSLTDQVRSWVVANGQTLREVLQSWCDKEGWDLVWTTAREYPIEASAVFKGRFVDVASALVRNFGRATPVPYAKFYKGNRVLVISTNEE